MLETTWAWIKRFKLLLATLGLLIVFLIYLMLSEESFWPTLEDFTIELMPNIATALLVYLAIGVLLSRAGISDLDELRDEIARRVSSVAPAPGVLSVHQHLDDTDWKAMFEGARQVDIVGRFFDGIVRDAQDGLVTFFKAGGEVRVITYNPDEPALVEIVNTQRNSDPSLHPTDVETRLIRGLRILDNARRTAGRPDNCIKIYKHRTSINYAGYCFDKWRLLFVPYAHFHSEAAREPRILFDLGLSPIMATFWRNEVERLTEASALDDALMKRV